MVGQAVVQTYRQLHGKAPAMADRGRGSHATRVSLYEAADLPLVDAVIQQALGDPPGIETPVVSGDAGGAP
jgi:hypothetical protein